MNKQKLFHPNGVALFLGTLLMSAPMFGQVDLSGVWQFLRGQYGQENGAGPDLGDYTGIPVNAEGRARGLSYSGSMLSEPWRQCEFYSPRYAATGPFALNIWSDTDDVTGKVTTWHMGAWIDKDIINVYMDGRPHPSPNAFHNWGGFATGQWQGDMLVIYTTHMKGSILRLNGIEHSDQATMTQYITRHGDLLSMLTYFEDPYSLAEPYVLSSVWQLAPKNNFPRTSPACEPIDESPRLEKDAAIVPHYLPGKNASAEEYIKFYNLPAEVAQGGPETVYPDIRKKLKDVYHYQPPEKCIRYCCDTGDPLVKCVRGGDTKRVQ